MPPSQHDPFADNNSSPGQPHSPQASPIPSNPLAYQQVGQSSSPNVSLDSPGPADGRGGRFVSSPLNPRQSSSLGGTKTRPASPTGSTSHGKPPDRTTSPNSSSSHAEKDHGLRGVMAGTVGGGYTPYPVSVKPKFCFSHMCLQSSPVSQSFQWADTGQQHPRKSPRKSVGAARYCRQYVVGPTVDQSFLQWIQCRVCSLLR